MNRLNLSVLLLVLSLSIKIVDSRFLDPRFAAVDFENEKTDNLEAELAEYSDFQAENYEEMHDWDLIFVPIFDLSKYNDSNNKAYDYIVRLRLTLRYFLDDQEFVSLNGRIIMSSFNVPNSTYFCHTSPPNVNGCTDQITAENIGVSNTTHFATTIESSLLQLSAKFKIMYVYTNIKCSEFGAYSDLADVLSPNLIGEATDKYLDQVVVFFIPDEAIGDSVGPCIEGQCIGNFKCISGECVPAPTVSYEYSFDEKENVGEFSTAENCSLDSYSNPKFKMSPLTSAMWMNMSLVYDPTKCYIDRYGIPSNNSSTGKPEGTVRPPILSTTTATDGTDANKPLLYSIIAICATVIVLALCCGCICLIKMKYRFSSLRLNFYARNVFRRNGSPSNAAAINDYGAAPKIGSQLDFVYDKWEINFNDLAINKNEKLGSGAFAAVYKGYLKGKNPLLENYGNLHFALEMAENSGNQVAVKMLHAHADDSNREELKKEIEFMKTLGYHPHILNMIGCVSSIYDPLLIVEYCANGDLLTLLRKNKDYIMMDPDEDCPAQADFCLTLRDLLSFAWQVSDGMVYMSSKNFIHRDVAARNILITKRMVAKVADFGLCRYTQENLYTTKGGKLPIKWMAIESLKLADYTSKSDVWAYGVFLFELFSAGDSPYPGIQPSEMTEYLLEGNRLEKPALCPDEIYKMMKEMWEPNPELRPSFEEIRQRLSGCLEISSDSYGYIQVSADYNRLYSFVDPRKVSKASANPVRRLTATAPESETGLELREIRANSSVQTPTAPPVHEGSVLEEKM